MKKTIRNIMCLVIVLIITYILIIIKLPKDDEKAMADIVNGGIISNYCDESENNLYCKEVGSLSLSEVNEIWSSNNSRNWLQSGKMDNEIDKKYITWSNI